MPKFHAIRRAESRLGIEATPEMILEWETRIRQGDARFLSRSDADVTIWRMKHDGITFRAVYNERARLIVTILRGKDFQSKRPVVLSKAELRRLSIRMAKGLERYGT